jgi:hypothetical protein
MLGNSIVVAGLPTHRAADVIGTYLTCPWTMVFGEQMVHPIGAQQVSLAAFYRIYLVPERLGSKVNSSMQTGF